MYSETIQHNYIHELKDSLQPELNIKESWFLHRVIPRTQYGTRELGLLATSQCSIDSPKIP